MTASKNRTVLITGCSSGFGLETVAAFLTSGWHVVATFRNAERRQAEFFSHLNTCLQGNLASFNETLTVASLDLTQSDQIESIHTLVHERFSGSLDCLINNAGTGLFGALEDITLDQLRSQIETNFLGTAHLTQSLLPFIRKSRGKILFVSSVLGITGMPLTSAYCASKYALEGLAESLYYELKPFQVQVALIEPGRFVTRFKENATWGKNSFSPQSVYFSLTQKYRKFREEPSPILASRDPKTVAQQLLRLAMKDRIPLRISAGPDARAMSWIKHLLFSSLRLALIDRVYRRTFYS